MFKRLIALVIVVFALNTVPVGGKAPVETETAPRVLDRVPMSYGPPGTWTAAPGYEDDSQEVLKELPSLGG